MVSHPKGLQAPGRALDAEKTAMWKWQKGLANLAANATFSGGGVGEGDPGRPAHITRLLKQIGVRFIALSLIPLSSDH